MKTRREIPELVSRVVIKWALMVVVALGAVSAHGQNITPLIEFTNVWKYDRSGTNFGAEWRTNDFDDSTWPSGLGLLGYEDVLAPYLLHVPSGLGTIIPVSGSVTTFYFRTTFEFSGPTNFVQLFATNLVDDGCAIWLNGQLAGTVRLPTNGLFNANTLAQGQPSAEGQLDVVHLRDFLREGENQLAVEVHQLAATSADILFGMRLMAVIPTPLVITNQPQGGNVTVGDSVTLQVGVSGGPVAYRWQKDGVPLPLPNAANPSYTITGLQLANAGAYRVIVSNAVNTVTSEVAQLNVVLDFEGPTVVSAIEDNGFGSNRIHVVFSERLLTTVPPTSRYSPRNLTNYAVIRIATGQTVEITNIAQSGSQVLLALNAADPDWIRFDDYTLTINNVADIHTNSIAPGSTIPVQWRIITNLFQDSRSWEFHNSAFLNPDVYQEPWYAVDYQPGPWWGQGLAPFYGLTPPSISCATLSQPQTAIGWQPEPVLFRTTFHYPEHWQPTATLSLRLGFDDGVVLYLNGTEVYRNNVGGSAGTPISAGTRAITTVGTILCMTNSNIVVSNLLPGINHLAAAVVQPNTATDGDVYFTLEMDAIGLLAFTTPVEPPPLLQLSLQSNNLLQFDWAGGGWFLESSTNFDAGPLSHPHGPWTQVPQLSRPYLWNLTNSPERFFRLRK